jgi:hypothetical protein
LFFHHRCNFSWFDFTLLDSHVSRFYSCAFKYKFTNT